MLVTDPQRVVVQGDCPVRVGVGEQVGSFGQRGRDHRPVAPADWVRELSRYDAGWLHCFSSRNNGELVAADWNDLNVPARVATYAVAGLPWLMRDNSGHRVAVNALGERYGVSIPYSGYDDLAEALRKEYLLRAASESMRRYRDEFTFDYHVDRLLGFFLSL